MITFKNIIKKFGDTIVLDNVSGQFVDGKVNMIIGLSGAGKSILLKCLIGLLGTNNGVIKFDDKIMTSDIYDPEMIDLKKNIGVLFQNGALFSSKTIEENIKFPLDMLTDMSEEDKKARVNYCLESVGLHDINDKFPNEVSGGMQKRVALARAIVNIPRYLFCDEPNSGLDPKTSLMIDELIKEITKKNKITTIVITHSIDSVINIGEYIIFLSKAKKKWEGNPKDILTTTDEDLNAFLQASKTVNIIKENNIRL